MAKKAKNYWTVSGNCGAVQERGHKETIKS